MDIAVGMDGKVAFFLCFRYCGRAARKRRRSLVAASTTFLNAFRGTDFRNCDSHCVEKVLLE